MKNNKVTLFIMSQKGFAVLQQITKDHKDLIEVVISSTDHDMEKDYYLEIKEHCAKNNIQFIDKKDYQKVKTNYVLAVSWRWIIPRSNFTLIVFHDSLLPEYRGFNPLVSMLINRETKIGVTVLIASDRYDQGDIIEQAYTKITYPIKISSAIEKVSENYKALALRIFEMLKKNNALATFKQNEKLATYSLWRDEQDYRINWEKDAEYIKRFIDAVGFPYKGASSIVNNKLVRIHDAELQPNIIIENRTPGKVFAIEDGCPVVVCGTGLLKLARITNSSGKSMIPFNKLKTRFE
jgi:methionyl-tRNA formyltransferase